ncbi:MAG: hypothetical protein AAF004_11785 [Pseudomonadota bacterium]
MNDMTDKDMRLDALIDGLDERIAPPRDLWPDIHAAIAPQSHKATGGFWAWRVAASVMATAALIGLIGIPRGDTLQMVQQEDVPQINDELVRFAGFDAAFVQVHEQSLEHLADQLNALPPDTQGVILGNLKVIRESITEINDAIEREPNNVQLRQLLQIAYQQELAIVSTVRESATTIEQMGSGI